MGSFSDLTLGDLTRGLARYRPVVVSVAAILVALVLLPKPARVSPVGLAGPTTESGVPAVQTSPVPQASGDAAEAVGSTTFENFSSPTTLFTEPTSDSFDGSSFAAGPPTPISNEDFTFAPTTGSDQPLRVVAKAWASRSAGTPLAANGVPAGTLPVGTRATQDDKLSFIRLSGDETILRLSEDPAGARTIAGPAVVQACPIQSAGWKEAEGEAFADAPQPDVSFCVEGIRSIEGVWTFDLSPFSERTGDRGFALRPGAGAGADFQVAFKVS